MNKQFGLFDSYEPSTFAVIYCSNFMKDTNGEEFFLKERIKSHITEYTANKICSDLNNKLYKDNQNCYLVIKITNINLL